MPEDAPRIQRFFYVATRATTFLGAIATDPQRAADLIPILEGPVFSEPGTFGFISQPSIFGRGIGASYSESWMVTEHGGEPLTRTPREVVVVD